MRRLSVVAAIAALLACATAPGPRRPGGQPATAARQALAAILAEHWDATLEDEPDTASLLGEARGAERWPEVTATAADAREARARGFLARLEALPEEGLEEQERLSRTIMIRALRLEVAAAPFQDWKMPADVMNGPHLLPTWLRESIELRTEGACQAWLARLHALPRLLDDGVAAMRLGLAEGLVVPRFVAEKVAAQAGELAAGPPEASPVAACLDGLPAEVPAAAQARLRQAVLAAVRDEVQPAYARFARFVRETYAPRGREAPGLWALPGGEARYALAVRRYTTTDLTPAEIHALGRAEVARIEGEMAALALRAGHPSLAAFRAAMAADPALRPTSREQILEIYRGHLAAMEAELPRLFGRLPRARLEVVEAPRFGEASSPGATYRAPSPDGSRPGQVRVNTGDFAERRIQGMESTAYHEGVPGHHLQGALQLEIAGLPPQRQRWLFLGAFEEGWALYAEGLAREAGRFRSPASEYGHLEMELLRAIRLVVDTGLHALRWSRQDVIDYFHAHSTLEEVRVQAETDRYVVLPGQALAYKVGQLRLLALRRRAQAALGPAFDLRAFHDLVLEAGALPLDVLEARVDRWIAARGAAAGRRG